MLGRTLLGTKALVSSSVLIWIALGHYLVSGSSAALADSISVNRCTPATGQRPDSCALFSAGNAANQGSGADSARRG